MKPDEKYDEIERDLTALWNAEPVPHETTPFDQDDYDSNSEHEYMYGSEELFEACTYVPVADFIQPDPTVSTLFRKLANNKLVLNRRQSHCINSSSDSE